MKHFLLLAGLALATGVGIEAQAQALLPLPQSPVTRMRDSLLAPLDKSRNPTGILYDRVISLANLDEYTKDPKGERPISSAAHFQQAYFELYSAAYSPTAPAFPIYRPEIGAAIAAAAATSFGPEKPQPGDPQTLPIGLLDYTFAVLDPDGVKAGTLQKSNGRYKDGKGSPYQVRSLTLASPLLDKVSSSQVRLLLPAALLLGNTGRQVQSVSITGAGGLKAQLQPGQSVLATLPLGLQQLTFTVRFTKGPQATSRATVLVEPPAQARPTSEVFADLTWVNGMEWTDYDGYTTYGQVEMRVVFNQPQSKSDGRVRRPVFVLDGFDPEDRRPMAQLQLAYRDFNALLQTPGQERDLVLINFPKSFRRVKLPSGATEWKYVDGGADYIERNALAFTAALHAVRNLHQANPAEKVTVIGPSMGGLITRYALAQMERNYAAAPPSNPLQSLWYTNVDTWISFDTPHQGANIPLGDQLFVDYFASVSPGAEAALGRLRSVAARQMLLVQNNPVLAQNLHVRFMQNLLGNGLPGSQGYPQTMRRVALANGSGDGLLQSQLGYPGQQTISMKVIKPFFWTEIDAVKAQVFYGPAANGSATVFAAQTNGLVGIFKDLATDVKRYQYSDYKGTYDLAPGGRYKTQADIEAFTMASDPPAGTYYKFNMTTRPDHAFIPTVSAIDFNYRALSGSFSGMEKYATPYTKLTGRAMRCNDETPFDAYYLSPTNTDHVTLNSAQGAWVARELFGVNQPPTFAGTNLPASSCPGTQVTLSIDGCLQGRALNSYNWSVSGPAVFVRTNSTTDNGQGSQVAVRPTGPGTITVSVVDASAGRSPSPPATYSFVSVDPSGSGLTISQDRYEVCPYSNVTLRAAGETAGPYYWTTQSHSNGNLFGPIDYYTTFSPTLNVQILSNNMHVTLQAPDRCSGQLAPPVASTIYLTRPEYCGEILYSISPVPSDGFLRVETLNASTPAQRAPASSPDVIHRSGSALDAKPLPKPLTLPDEANPHIYSADLYDGRGQKVGSASTREGKLSMPTSQLATGIYHLVIMRGGQRTTQNILVSH